METSVCHFAISTLQCSFLDAIKSLGYAFINWFAFIFIFFVNLVLECFLKAGSWDASRALNTNARNLGSVGLKKALKWVSGVWVMFLHHTGSRLVSILRILPFTVCGNKKKVWGEQGKMWHRLGIISLPCSFSTVLWLRLKMPHYPLLTLFYGILDWHANSNKTGRRAHLKK